MEKQPAKRGYFFGQCYLDILYLIKRAWSMATKPIKNECKRIKDLFDDRHIFAAIIAIICDPIVFLVITLAILVVNTIFTLILLLGFVLLGAGIFLAYSLTFFVDWIFCIFKGITNHCPTCQTKFMLPTYECPKCGAKHSALRPSKYGIFHRKCNCGHKLPTTFFNGRQKLKAICPSCGTGLKDGGEHIEIVVPVVGGPSAGKTCFINMAISQIERTAPQNNLSFAYSPTAMDDYAANRSSMQSGILPEKTNDLRLKYYQFYLTRKDVKLKNLISLCDVAGELFDTDTVIGEQIGFRNADAFIMLVDPLSVAKYRETQIGRINCNSYGASEKPLDEILSTLITTLENMHCITSKSAIKTDVAVVFTKCDIPGLENIIGPSAVRKYRQEHDIKSLYDATNEVCERFLIEYEEQNFLNSLKSKFRSIQFFTCSALGHVANGSRFTPSGVEDPVLWVIDKASASINLKEKWGRKI